MGELGAGLSPLQAADMDRRKDKVAKLVKVGTAYIASSCRPTPSSSKFKRASPLVRAAALVMSSFQSLFKVGWRSRELR